MGAINSWSRTLYSVGSCIGPTIGGLFYDIGGLYLPFLIIGIMTIIFSIFTLVALPKLDHEISATAGRSKISTTLRIMAKVRQSTFYLPSKLIYSFAESRNTHTLPGQPYLLHGDVYVRIYLCPVSGSSPCQQRCCEVNLYFDGHIQFHQQISDRKFHGQKGECTSNILAGWQCLHALAIHVLRENSHTMLYRGCSNIKHSAGTLWRGII